MTALFTPSADLLTFSEAQRRVLDRMDSDLGYPFADIANDCGLSVSETRAIVHQFHRMGMTGFGVLYSEDGPAICGKGYWLLRHGFELQSEMRRSLGWRALGAMRDAAGGIPTEGVDASAAPFMGIPVPQGCAPTPADGT